MNSLIFYTPENKPGKRDGDEFAREAHALADIIGGRLVALTGSAKRKQFEAACDAAQGESIGRVAFFGHGTERSLVKVYGIKSVDKMARALHKCCSPGVTVMMYSCKSGVTFGEALRNALVAVGLPGCRVTGHSSLGHTTKNPYVVTWPNADPAGWIINARDKATWRAWKKALKTDFRFRFPWMRVEDVERHIRGDDARPNAAKEIATELLDLSDEIRRVAKRILATPSIIPDRP